MGRSHGYEAKIARLVGDKQDKLDPVTGNRYELDGGRLRLCHLYHCPNCGKEMWRSRRRARENKSGLCQSCARRAAGAPNGSRRVNKTGYVQIKIGGVWKLEHRAIMEAALNRPLKQRESVHHINGNRSDNRLENLQLRQGQHGSGVVMHCLDCGSHNIQAKAIGGGGW